MATQKKRNKKYVPRLAGDTIKLKMQPWKVRSVFQPNEYPSSYLTAALTSGRLVRDGKYWRLGSDVVDKVKSDTPPTGSATEKDIPEATKEATASEPADDHGTETVPEFGCALWSDGELQLVRDGENLALLSKAEADVLRTYLERFSREPA